VNGKPALRNDAATAGSAQIVEIKVDRNDGDPKNGAIANCGFDGMLSPETHPQALYSLSMLSCSSPLPPAPAFR
jgi:hypothetical protein